jgi:hypothetical protein
MDKCTPKSAETLINKVTETVLNNVNDAVCAYKKHATIAMRLSLEETLIENLTFIKLVADQSIRADYLLMRLDILINNIMLPMPVFEIEMSVNEIEIYTHVKNQAGD